MACVLFPRDCASRVPPRQREEALRCPRGMSRARAASPRGGVPRAGCQALAEAPYGGCPARRAVTSGMPSWAVMCTLQKDAQLPPPPHPATSSVPKLRAGGGRQRAPSGSYQVCGVLGRGGSSQQREETVQDGQPVPTARDATWGSRVAPFIVIGIAAMEAGGRGGTAREAGAPWGESGCLLHFPQSLAALQ